METYIRPTDEMIDNTLELSERRWKIIKANEELRAAKRAMREAKEYARDPNYNRLQWESRLKAKYGIDLHDYANLYVSQKGRCGICRKGLIMDVETHLDHKHVTGYDKMSADEKRKHIRGLLCRRCNVELGVAENLGIGRILSYLKMMK